MKKGGGVGKVELIQFNTSRANAVRGESRAGMGWDGRQTPCTSDNWESAWLPRKHRHLPFQLKHSSSFNPLLIKKIFTIGSIKLKPLWLFICTEGKEGN